jgi:hypothetical protein
MHALIEKCVERCNKPGRGDLDGHGGTNHRDLAILGRAWLSRSGQPRWNPACDINIPYDGKIDERDLGRLVQDWLAGAR